MAMPSGDALDQGFGADGEGSRRCQRRTITLVSETDMFKVFVGNGSTIYSQTKHCG